MCEHHRACARLFQHVVHGVLTTSGSCQLSDEQIWLIWELFPSAITSDWYVVTDHCFGSEHSISLVDAIKEGLLLSHSASEAVRWRSSMATGSDQLGFSGINRRLT
jgi:hypothetical protein